MAIPEGNEKEGKTEEAPPPKSKKKLFIIIGVVVLLAVIGAVLALMLGGKAKAPEGEGAEIAEEQMKEVKYKTARMETFVVNLSESTSFLKVTMLLEYDPSILEGASKKGSAGGGAHGGGGSGGEGGGEGGAKGGGLPAIIQEREPMIKDAIIRVLSSKTAQEVLSAEGKEKLKEELIEAINEAIGLEEAPITNIYFIEFIVQ